METAASAVRAERRDAHVWNGHSCPLLLTLILTLIPLPDHMSHH